MLWGMQIKMKNAQLFNQSRKTSNYADITPGALLNVIHYSAR